MKNATCIFWTTTPARHLAGSSHVTSGAIGPWGVRFPARVHDQFNLMISFEGVCELLHTSMGRFRFLVASPPVRDLLLSAKDLFIAAMVDSSGNQDHYLYLGVGSAPSRLPITQSYSTCRPGSRGSEHNKIARPPRRRAA